MTDTFRTSHMMPTVLFIGTYHIANNNRDLFNVQFDDMLSPHRQQEIANCVDQLKRFRPTKVAVEKVAEQADDLNREYQQYCSGSFPLTANEIHQLGFRTAAACGHKQIYAIDWNKPIDWDQAYTFAREHQSALLNQIFATQEQRIQEMNGLVKQLTISELLYKTNEPQHLAENHQTYLAMMRIGIGQQYTGIDVIKEWYARNMRIFVNLTRIIDSSEDRVLVIYGAGHIPLLSQFARDSGLYTLEDATAYLS